MCGITAFVGKASTSPNVERVEAAARRLAHRGPDFCKSAVFGRSALGHARLAIVDPSSGAQPLVDDDGAVAANGEIYNHGEMREGALSDYAFRSSCDCEVLLPACARWTHDAPAALDGVFAFVWMSLDGARFVAARDPVGVNPLYYAETAEGWWFASERKALPDVRLDAFPPGHVLTETGELRRYHTACPWGPPTIGPAPSFDAAAAELREALERAVAKRMMADVEFGVLLSGGLDSSLVAALAQREAARRSLPPLKSFSIGLEGAPDLEAAREVAARIGTEHHEVHFTVEEGLAAIPEVVRAIETVDTTTVRASTPMLLLARWIRRHTAVKMVMSGEGADELLCGYLYFHLAPDPAAAAEESARKVRSLHMYDCQRANLATMAASIEARVPFLDLSVIRVAMQRARPEDKIPRARQADGAQGRRVEKALLREAFAGSELLPPSVLWRQKEQFGDGVGHSWIDSLRDHARREAASLDREALAACFGRAPTAERSACLWA